MPSGPDISEPIAGTRLVFLAVELGILVAPIGSSFGTVSSGRCPCRMAQGTSVGRAWQPQDGCLALAQARSYRREWLAKDLVAGLVLIALLVPQGMAYAELAGLPPVNGLYASMIPLLAYALLGPSRILVLAPDSAIAPMVAAAIIPLAGGDMSERVAIAGFLAVLVGIICIAGAALGAGFLTDLISRPVRLGYLAGIALTVIVSQIPTLLGIDRRWGTFDPGNQEYCR